jgi:CheY-specific phosphatase CheX
MTEVVPDVLGELANMIGGNIKCVLNLGLSLSIPLVTEGDYVARAAGYEVRQRFIFECADGMFQVIVLRPVA